MKSLTTNNTKNANTNNTEITGESSSENALYSGKNYRHCYDIFDEVVTFWSKEQLNLTIADMVAFKLFSIVQTRPNESIYFQGDMSERKLFDDISSDEFDLILHIKGVAATVFEPCKIYALKTNKYNGVLFNNPQCLDEAFPVYIDTIKTIYNSANDSCYPDSDVKFLNNLRDENISYPIAEPETFTSITTLLNWVLEIFSATPVAALDDGLTSKRGAIKLNNTDGVIDEYIEHHLIYDIELKVFAVIHDGNLIKSLGFTTDDSDSRMTTYQDLCE